MPKYSNSFAMRPGTAMNGGSSSFLSVRWGLVKNPSDFLLFALLFLAGVLPLRQIDDLCAKVLGDGLDIYLS